MEQKMSGMKHVLVVLLALYMGLAHSLSWDIVVARSNRLEFYNDGTLTYTAKPASHRIKWIAYDPVHDRILFADKYNTQDSASSYDIATSTTKSLIKKKTNRYIQNFAYEPATELLFGIITNRIYSFPLKSGVNDVDGDLVISLEKEKPRDITVDSCEGYIYWTTSNYEIERARFNGTDREFVMDSNTTIRKGLTIDQQTKKMYWIASEEYNDGGFSIESADLDGNNRITLHTERETDSTPDQLTVSKDFISWGDKIEMFFWQLPKDTLGNMDVKPRKVSMTTPTYSYGSEDIAANYKVEEQTEGINDCSALKSQLPNNSETSDFARLFCVHGTKVSEESLCECTEGYTGERCDVSVCQNYCFQGNCSVSADGQPKCRCNAGYTGERCEVNLCHEYCLNDGVCTLDMNDERVCQCKGHYEGQRCDIPDFLVKCFHTVTMFKDVLNADLTSLGLDIGVNSTCASTDV